MIVVDDAPDSPTKSSQARADPRGAAGSPPPAYPGLSSQDPYKPAPAAASQTMSAATPALGTVHPESAINRFFKAFWIAVAIWAVLGGLTEIVIEVAGGNQSSKVCGF